MKNFSDMLKEALESDDVERNFQEMLDMLDECYEYMVQGRNGSNYRMRGNNSFMSDEDYHFDKSTLQTATDELENADDSKGAKWNLVQTNMLMRDNGLKTNEKFNEYDFNYTMNMLYSDFSKLLGSDVMNYFKMAKCFLEDEDAPSGKAYRYYIAMHPEQFEEYDDYYEGDEMFMNDDYDDYYDSRRNNYNSSYYPRDSRNNYNRQSRNSYDDYYDEYDYPRESRSDYSSNFDRSNGRSSDSGRGNRSSNRNSRGGNRGNSSSSNRSGRSNRGRNSR